MQKSTHIKEEKSMEEVKKVVCTKKASELISDLKQKHGPLMFHQSGGCCDGSSPMCYQADEVLIGEQDILLGYIEECPFYIGKAQYGYWKHTQLIIDVVEGRGGMFSLEGPEGVRFLTRSRIFTEYEKKKL
jgi:uncharacterized protein (DUF779 family)